ncbi:serine hydrolase domain-containing protein [Pseudonocardia spinosispora]|uniref:serine hydrolase domain-containing protein n=1 Tax=Pseudonocardia spinosispora TaxID=103441 RepID=UPI000421FA63|nr:serine hydrolase domain-containing protein [Pseudonocardia spinosispora]
MPSTSTNEIDIDRLLRRAVSSGAVPGVAAMAADDSGILCRAVSGDRAPGQPWACDTVAWIASMTKIIVSVAALQLVERGDLELDEPVGRVLPALREPAVLEGFSGDGRPVLRRARSHITLRHLLAHTAGYGYHFWNAEVGRYQQHAGLPNIIECREATLTTPLLFDPGTRWNYGTNTDWVGKAIEAVSGLSIEQYLRGHVLDPLGMHDTGFLLTEDRRRRLATMFARTEDGPVGIDFEITQEPEFQMSGGGMYGTPGDFLAFLRMLLGGGALDGVRILRSDTLAEAAGNQIGGLTIGRFTSADPGTSADVEFLPGVTKKWSLLGMLNAEPTSAGRSAGSLFWAGLANTYFWVDWDRRDTGVLFTQLLPFGDTEVLDLFDRFETLVHTFPMDDASPRA